MIISKDEDIYIIKIFKNKIENVDIYDIDFISTFFKDILIKLKNKYNIKGFCDIEAFINKDYGMIIEINNLYKYDEDIDVKIRFHIDTLFMCEINYYDLDCYDDCYLYENKYYCTYKNIYDCDVIYRDNYKIIKEGLKIK